VLKEYSVYRFGLLLSRTSFIFIHIQIFAKASVAVESLDLETEFLSLYYSIKLHNIDSFTIRSISPFESSYRKSNRLLKNKTHRTHR
jgi:hypothetical protein